MTYPDQLPPERDLPVGQQTRMRHQVLTAMAARPGRRPARRRAAHVLVAGLATAACAVVAVATTGGFDGSERPQPQVVALADSALSPLIRDAGNLCLTQAKRDATRVGDYPPPFIWPEHAQPSMVNFAEAEDRAIVIYRLNHTAIMCTMEPTSAPSNEWGSGMVFAALPSWLPGPIAGQSASSSAVAGGKSAISGFVSQRVAAVVLDDGAGHRSAARLADGTFVVLSDGDLAEDEGELISYDDQGREIDRRPAFDLGAVDTTCWADSNGDVVVHGATEKNASPPPASGCGNAEAWAPPKGWTPA
jgi:hypothetical protein